MPDIKKHRRINDILLGRLERPALLWLAEHLPRWATPDLMTVIGVLGSIIIFISYILSNKNPAYLWLASAGFVINWFGDSLDGTIARYRKIERPIYGFFVDHTVDAISETLVFLGIGLSQYVRFEIAAMALIGYLLLSVYTYVRTSVSNVFQISFLGFGPTEMRVIAILVNTYLFFRGNVTFQMPWGDMTLFDLVLGIVASALIIAYIVMTTRESIRLAKIGK